MSLPARTEGYLDKRLAARVLKVAPGDYRALQARDVPWQPVLATTLGSCVAACMYEDGTGIGGMNHFLLPEGGENETARYGVHAMELLINALLKLGARRSRLRAKLFGGGAVLAAVTSIDVGRQNAAFVRRFLATEGIPVVAEDLLGPHPRKLLFFPATAEARVRHLPLVEGRSIAVVEQRKRDQARQRTPAHDVELF
ncbi:chemoreceptor glutamine deamidase CheD [Algiphilus sp.]|uniref:chemoreceptor glutamine deamidase CheD n=1 Tax=Algiphilus sp. TaxID=1872431 RepID=UPI003C510367